MYKYTKKLAKITGMVKCPDCPIAVEKDQNYCSGCGRKLHNLKCDVCGKVKNDTDIRECGFSREIHDEKVIEQICDDCEHEHLMDI